MILVRKNVYKDVCLFENVFNVCKMFGNLCVCFENRKDVVLKWSKKCLSCSFSFPLKLLSYH